MKIYLAGPDVFLRDAREMGLRKKEICTRHGLTGLFPLDDAIGGSPIAHSPEDRDAPLSLRIFRGCVAMMEAADAVIANLTPFRGPSADAGTVYELGFMAARGKLCTGYSNAPGAYLDRVDREAATRDGRRIQVDRDGNEVEDFTLADNLMIVYALTTCGHPILTPDIAPADRWRDLALFENCVRWIAGRSIKTPTA
jgi:nucleoside 2-deoxyribosyltransferase